MSESTEDPDYTALLISELAEEGQRVSQYFQDDEKTQRDVISIYDTTQDGLNNDYVSNLMAGGKLERVQIEHSRLSGNIETLQEDYGLQRELIPAIHKTLEALKVQRDALEAQDKGGQSR